VVFISIASVSLDAMTQNPGRRVAPTQHVRATARIAFGKHRGRTFHHVAVDEPGYLEWMLRVGAGSQTERECAKLALSETRGGSYLPPPSPRPAEVIGRSTPSPRISSRQPDSPPGPPTPEDPKSGRGLIAAVRALLLPRRKGD
jgi:hypothetical protein